MPCCFRSHYFAALDPGPLCSDSCRAAWWMALTFDIFLLPAEPLFLTVELFVDSDEQALSYDPVIFVCDCGFLGSDEYDHQPGPICFTSSRNHSLSLFLVVKASYFPILILSSFYFPTSSVCNPSWSNRCSKFIPIREKYNLMWSSMYMGSRGWVQNFCLFVFHIFPQCTCQSASVCIEWSGTSRSSLCPHSSFNSEYSSQIVSISPLPQVPLPFFLSTLTQAPYQ